MGLAPETDVSTARGGRKVGEMGPVNRNLPERRREYREEKKVGSGGNEGEGNRRREEGEEKRGEMRRSG